ncbi:MAG: DUF5916 domain-containing protein [Longimicrobiales bacterium]|nr:DUF5916 domain-containing protein [Longimicrobiales bacterium]
MKRSTRRRIRVLAAAMLALPGPLAALQEPPAGKGSAAGAIEALRMGPGATLHLDGSLDDAQWAAAIPVSDFTQQEPSEGGQPSRLTEVRVAYDADALYIGAKIYDDPDGILAYQKQRDAGLGTDDRFMWILDTFVDGRTGYFFEINAAGLMGDGLITGGGGGGGFGGGGGGGGGGGPGGGGGFGVNKSWDGIWEARVARLPDGWSAEIRIPFRTLNFDPALDTWGINFQRTIRRANEEILWRGHLRNQGLTRPIHAGRLTGLQGLSQGVGLEVRPSAVGSWKRVEADAEPTSFPRDLSVDVGYSITPSLRGSLSVNTDFAEVEVDDRRVNLTRFPMRFPERRAFFLEGSGVFSFAESSGSSPFFSRRIGLEQGEQIPLNYGARLGGQTGPWQLGFIQVGTASHTFLDEDATPLPSESFTVARVRRSFLSQSTAGAIYTRRATGRGEATEAPGDRHTAGVDLNLFTSRFFGDNNAQFEAFFVWNSNPETSVQRSLGDLTARGLRLAFPNDVWSGHLSFREFGEAYDPAMGFVTRNAFRRVEPRLGWRPRTESLSWLRRVDMSAQYTYQESLVTGIVEEKQWQFGLLGLDFESGDNLSFNANRSYEYLDEAFEVSDGIEIAPGGYTTWELSMRGRTAGRRKVSLTGEFSRSGFWDGDRNQVQAGLTLRPTPGLSLSGNWEINDVTLPRGDFTASVYRLSSGWDASPWLSLNGNVQYDDVSDVVGLFTKLRWIVKPGNDVYLVYTHNLERLYGDDVLDRRFSTLSRGASLKVNYTYRF